MRPTNVIIIFKTYVTVHNRIGLQYVLQKSTLQNSHNINESTEQVIVQLPSDSYDFGGPKFLRQKGTPNEGEGGNDGSGGNQGSEGRGPKGFVDTLTFQIAKKYPENSNCSFCKLV